MSIFSLDGSTGSGSGTGTPNPYTPSALGVTDWSSRLFAQRMDTIGDGTGATNHNVNGSSTPQIFRIAPQPGEEMWINKVVFYVADNGTADAGFWGNGITMTAGIDIQLVNDGVVIPHTNFSILTFGDLASLTFNMIERSFGSGPNLVVARYTPGRSVQGLYLSSATNDAFEIVINDNLTGLVEQYTTARGLVRPIPS